MNSIQPIDLNFLECKEAIASYLIETSEGPILIETGPHSTYPILKEAIKKQGYEIEDIKHVFITHIHLDHAGAAWKFAEHGAKVYLHPFGVRHMADPSKLMASAKMIYKDDMDRLWGEMHEIPEDLLIAPENGSTIKIGDVDVTAWFTPGHANHHIAWQIEDFLFTGDVAGVKIGDGPVVAPCPPPDINLEKWQASIDLIRKISPSKLYLTHFGVVTDVVNHLIALEKDLYKVAEIVKNYSENDYSLEKMEELFTTYVNNELKSLGLKDEALKQYDAANPPFMSVAGLLRYWKKKN
ncbi:MBL fold metallo-hydrolase [Flammeovirga yaeyamensis]|uniref:MBL fold metallo-hydrolase n=1 Tax=Flammeovirga yaeyamensis TaxID=367791 RepID=A0AAX1NBH8_9BACT|nr:MBL fold metallo-hydrolase [Flammeovirga yaeyamensis]MBB3698810.1 glyoxylase-like metal-dependent hydrolase (beta-lactamase superfamily II) [Flammeovirga yaeyamensis]NMF37395.1 MBL fold metallo-hydrolase [Flammeovirga yaeyamensis]QWG03791.1 MBL fold metallo-hydrolase [Flammeovirga yaeyamensis]